MKHLRLAKISTLKDANTFLETQYWPEWNEHFARPVADFPNHHRALSEQLNLARDRRVRCEVNRGAGGSEQAEGTQRSQRGRPKQMDAGLLRSSESAAVEIIEG